MGPLVPRVPGGTKRSVMDRARLGGCSDIVGIPRIHN